MSVDWHQIRRQFPVLRDWVYLNTATFGPVPQCAVDASLAHFRHRDEQACLDFLDWFTDADRVRRKAAALIGAEADDIAFIPNTGTALGWLIQGIDWQPGDHILSLAHEFPNNLYYPLVLERRGVEFTQASLPEGRFSIQDFTALVRQKTRLVLASSVNYSTGLRPPLEEIGKAVEPSGAIFCVDGTQSVGALEIDVKAIGAGVLLVHAYKWLCCPTGIGFAYFHPAVRRWLEPSVYSWRSHRAWRQVDSLHHGAPELPLSAAKYEGGIQNFPGIYAMEAVFDLLASAGAGAVERRVLALAAQTRDILRSHGGQLVADRYPHYDSSIVTAQFEGVDTSRLALELRQWRIAVAARKGSLRVSPHFFNHEEDLAKLDQVLGILLRRA
jgi:selenocysteine lyase/cysteine desulfurase